ncbi:HDOD domain-containing protein [Metasolibacillus sp. FSL H7-0170]|uniref:EAL and HDOD domain-containing protein n=1 Tax=Metasolibacillus TaxID=2703677 RepID=UPI00079426E5|nr:HDOD domain-containing protein [Metasolibacillus fluoroglycofenilyticus]KYG89434.1 histidine kinase [[Bacillus] sp. KCTC 13219]
MEVFVGRQPIFNANKQIIAYELLYRNKNLTAFPMINEDVATIKVLINSFLHIGAEKITQGKPVFINFTENLLESSIDQLLKSSQVVIEILENVQITPKLIQRVRELKEKGFKVALDDFVLDKQVESYNELFQYIDYIKIDFLATTLEERKKIERKVQEKFPHIQLLAEKVEEYDQFKTAKASNYQLFQGYFFEKPQIVKGNSIPPNTIPYLNILLLLSEENPNVQLIAENIEKDLSLAYKLLQMINNATGHVKVRIYSIRQAIMMIGIPNLRKWIYFVAMGERQIDDEEDFFEEIMRASLFRAKVCEILAKRNRKKNHPEYFLVGMFSLIDILLKSTLEEIVQKLPLSNRVIDTILGQQTEMTPYLQFSMALDKLEWDKLQALGENIGLNIHEMDELYSEALAWAEKSL